MPSDRVSIACGWSPVGLYVSAVLSAGMRPSVPPALGAQPAVSLQRPAVADLPRADRARARLAVQRPALALVEATRSCVVLAHPEEGLGDTSPAQPVQRRLHQRLRDPRSPRAGDDVQGAKLCVRSARHADDLAVALRHPRGGVLGRIGEARTRLLDPRVERGEVAEGLAHEWRERGVPRRLVGADESLGVLLASRADGDFRIHAAACSGTASSASSSRCRKTTAANPRAMALSPAATAVKTGTMPQRSTT